MPTKTAPIAAPNEALAAGTVEFLESRHRISGLVREIFIARGWLRKSRLNGSSYQLTPKGARYLAQAGVQAS